jgi:DNA processing protein
MTFFEDYRSSFQTLLVHDSPYAEIFKSIQEPVGELYICSHNLHDLMTRPRVAIVGTRKVTPYGRLVTEKFAGELAGQGIVIVSGLAFGVDSIAHEAALEAGGLTIAVLPSSLSRIYPSAHTSLARRIIGQGGALISEYPIGTDIAFKNQFVERNRIVSGMSDALVITEAAKGSGTIHTAHYALDQGKNVFVVPGNITSPSSEGTNTLLKKPEAHVAMTPDDIIESLGLAPQGERPAPKGRTGAEQTLINLLAGDVRRGEDLLTQSKLEVSEYNHALTMLELTGKITALGSNQWALRCIA